MKTLSLRGSSQEEHHKDCLPRGGVVLHLIGQPLRSLWYVHVFGVDWQTHRLTLCGMEKRCMMIFTITQLLCWLCFPNLTPPLNFLGKYLCQKLGGVVGCLEVGCDLVPSLLLRRPFDTIDKVFS